MKNGQKQTWHKLAFYLALAALTLIIPLIVRSPFYLDAFISIYTYSILVIGFVLIWVTGRLSLGQAGFFAIGAYASALMVMRLGLPFWLALPLAGIVAAVFGALIGSIVIRKGGFTFILLTWSFAEVIRLIITNQTSILGGNAGIDSIPAPNPISFFGLATVDFTSTTSYYYLILFLLFLIVFFLWKIYNTRLGTVLRSLSQSDSLAKSLGVNVFRYRLLAFCIAAFLAGLAGSFEAHYVGYLAPTFFTLSTSVNIMVYAVVGGVFNYIAGPLIGTTFLVMLGRFLAGTIFYELIIYGIALIIVAFFLPRGLVSSPGLLLGLLKRFTRFGRKWLRV